MLAESSKYEDLDLRAYFDSIRQDLLLAKVEQRVGDPDVLHILKIILKASGKLGVPQGGVISPLLSNLYLNEVDRMLERAKEVTRNSSQYTHLEYARFADDLVVLTDHQPNRAWVLGALVKRLREEFAKLHVEINEEKSWIVDLRCGDSFGYLGFEFRRVRTRKGRWRPHYVPKLKKRTALLQELKVIFRSHRSQPVDRVIAKINPILRGWVRYFAAGFAGRCFGYVKAWVERKVRRHLAHARGRKGIGWNRWNRRWIYETLGLYKDYRLRRPVPKAPPT